MTVLSGGRPATAPHPDRLLPADPGLRDVARRLYAEVAGAPILSPHGHVEAAMLADDEPFTDPASLLITPDHYVTRMLHAHGVGLDRLGLGGASDGGTAAGADRVADERAGGAAAGADTAAEAGADPRAVWRALCEHWRAFLGTPVRYWFETELFDLFGVDVPLGPDTADATFDQVAETLRRPEFRPRALFDRFNIAVLATTDDPVSDLAAHRRLAQDPTFTGRVLPTFRPDRYLDPADPGWAAALAELAEVSGVDLATHAGLLAALRERRQYFIAHGATASDQSALDLDTEPLPGAEAERIHATALAGWRSRRGGESGAGGHPGQLADGASSPVSAADAARYRATMLFRCIEMARDDGLVMQLHGGVLRNHHRPTLRRFGPDTGHDLPTPTEFTRGLRPALEAFGTDPGLRMVLFTVDETTFSRDLAPLAGFYPSVFVGAPWWFLDTPAAIARYRDAVTDSAGFSKTSGFVDDTRAYCSIPARHDMSRRCDAAYLARLVGEHRITEDDALMVARDLVDGIPRTAFRLG